MDVQKAYNIWAEQYDTAQNKTRDFEAIALRSVLNGPAFDACLEIGCGTGKNTAWLRTQSAQVTAVDFSAEMLAKAQAKWSGSNVRFHQADINEAWHFVHQLFDLITFSLVLEHIENLDAVFEKAAKAAAPNGYMYVGELHPFKQYTGSKARFETAAGVQVVPCFTHHVSDFTGAAKRNGFEVVRIEEWFDEEGRTGMPRILTLLFQKK